MTQWKLNSVIEVCSFCEGYGVVKVENVVDGKVKSITVERCHKRCRNGFFR